MIACITVTGAIAVPVITLAFVLTVVVLRMREHRNELQYERDEARARFVDLVGFVIERDCLWEWPERLAEEDSANPVAQPSDGCYSGGMQPAKGG